MMADFCPSCIRTCKQQPCNDQWYPIRQRHRNTALGVAPSVLETGSAHKLMRRRKGGRSRKWRIVRSAVWDSRYGSKRRSQYLEVAHSQSLHHLPALILCHTRICFCTRRLHSNWYSLLPIARQGPPTKQQHHRARFPEQPCPVVTHAGWARSCADLETHEACHARADAEGCAQWKLRSGFSNVAVMAQTVLFP